MFSSKKCEIKKINNAIYSQNSSFFAQMLKLITYLFLLSAFSAYSQILDNREGKTFGDVPFFNESFIKRNKLRTIKGNYSTKASLDYIKKSKDVYYYEFNAQGQLIQDYRTQYGDTIINTYQYDSLGRIELIRKSDNNGFQSYHYTYDKKNRITSQEFRRDVNKVGSKTNFVLDRTFIISTEKFRYTDLEGLNYKKFYLNHVDKVYKEEFFYYNKDGYLIKQEGRMKMGSGLNVTTYSYDELGRVKEKLAIKQLSSKSTTKWIYKYDEHSNVLSQHYYKNNKYLTEYQIVYAEETLLLDAIITRDDETNFVTILDFVDYTFFD